MIELIVAGIALIVIIVIAWAIVRFVLRLTGCVIQAAIIGLVAIAAIFVISRIL